jgi:hypothetical protein
VEEKSEESLSLLTDWSLDHLLPETMALGWYIIVTYNIV